MNLDTQATVYTLAWLLWAASYMMQTILFCYLAGWQLLWPAKMGDICSKYGHRFDIKFNPRKSQTTVVGGPAPSGFVLKLNEAPAPLIK